MARYREKDATDLAWNAIRMRLTRQLDMEIRIWRDPVLNGVLTSAWDKFTKAIENGEVLELENAQAAFVQQALAESGITEKLEAQDALDA